MQIDYEFEELNISFGNALLAYGTATFEDDGDGEFYVKHIKLSDGTSLRRPGPRARTFREELFESISKALYASRDANETWADACAAEGRSHNNRQYSTLHVEAGSVA